MDRLPAPPISARARKALEAAARRAGLTPSAYALEAVLARLAREGYYIRRAETPPEVFPRPRARYRKDPKC